MVRSVTRSIPFVVMAALVAAASCKSAPGPAPAADAPADARTLRAPAAFDGLAGAERSQALFVEATRVMLHPRCANCHPAGDTPWQGAGEARHPHDPPVLRGPGSDGVVGMECGTCHQDRNQPLARVPGAPKWHLAPAQMAWLGKTPAQLCEQLKDRARNGQRSLAQIFDHSAHDELVAWGWEPGATREPAPGTQQTFGALINAWIATGAHCP
jgi:hypothetical protein